MAGGPAGQPPAARTEADSKPRAPTAPTATLTPDFRHGEGPGVHLDSNLQQLNATAHRNQHVMDTFKAKLHVMAPHVTDGRPTARSMLLLFDFDFSLCIIYITSSFCTVSGSLTIDHRAQLLFNSRSGRFPSHPRILCRLQARPPSPFQIRISFTAAVPHNVILPRSSPLPPASNSDAAAGCLVTGLGSARRRHATVPPPHAPWSCWHNTLYRRSVPSAAEYVTLYLRRLR